MIHVRRAIIFLALFVQGCTEKFVVAEKVSIGMGKDKLAFVDLKGQEIAPLSRKIRDKLSQIFTGANKTKGK